MAKSSFLLLLSLVFTVAALAAAREISAEVLLCVTLLSSLEVLRLENDLKT
jgi:hypothetical protein